MRRAKTFLITVTTAALALGFAAPSVSQFWLEETAIFIEINDTDGDAGIQLFFDGEGWDTMQFKDPSGNVLLEILGENRIGMQGLTEGFFESAEPSFDVQTLQELLDLFPEGLYKFSGRTSDGESLGGAARLTQAIPDAPVLISPAEDETVDRDNVVVRWEKVPDLPGSLIVGYEVIVERDEGHTRVFKADMRRGAAA